MDHRKHIYNVIVALVFLLLGGGCATVVAPSGGPEDKAGPALLYIWPDSETTNFDAQKIVFGFDEYLKQGAYASEVFISPIPESPPEVTVNKQELTVKFTSRLLDNTTYVVTIGTGIKDNNAGNKRKEPIVYAFSTGDYLDSLSFNGNVQNAWSGQGEKDFSVLLFPADSIRNDSFFKVQPAYVAKTDEYGFFRFDFLHEGRYRMLAVKDEDGDYQFSQQKEKIAIYDKGILELDTTKIKVITLKAFYLDEEPLRVASARWANSNTLVLSFKESVKHLRSDSLLGFYLSDSSGNITGESFAHQLPEGADNQILLSISKQQCPFILKTKNLRDTLENQLDTIIRIDSLLSERKYRDRLIVSSRYDPFEGRISISTLWPVALDSSEGISLLDTAGKELKVSVTKTLYQLYLKPEETPDYTITYKLLIDVPTVLGSEARPDSMGPINVKFLDPDQFCSINGKIETADSITEWILYLRNDKGSIIQQQTGSSFDFSYLPAGKYTFWLIDDKDRNGYWTPGDIASGRLPEPIYKDPEPLELSAKWEVEDYVIIPKEIFAAPPDSLTRSGRGRGQ